MARSRKKFKADRTPEYWVITKWEPENIDGINLKFKDLHVIYGLMVDFTDNFVRTIEAEHKRHEARLDFNAPLTENARKEQNVIRILFSAQLSTYATILYYLREVMNDAGRAWLTTLRDKDPALASFDRLRNREVHNEAMHTLIGSRFRITAAQPLYSSLETKEIHMHQALLHEGVGFYPPPVAQTKEFAGHPGLVQFVTFESILQLTHTMIHSIGSVLNEAVSLGHWTGTGEVFECEIRHTAPTGDSKR